MKDFSIKCDQIRSFTLIWPHLLEKSLMENFIFCAVAVLPWYSVDSLMAPFNHYNKHNHCNILLLYVIKSLKAL